MTFQPIVAISNDQSLMENKHTCKRVSVSDRFISLLSVFSPLQMQQFNVSSVKSSTLFIIRCVVWSTINYRFPAQFPASGGVHFHIGCNSTTEGEHTQPLFSVGKWVKPTWLLGQPWASPSSAKGGWRGRSRRAGDQRGSIQRGCSCWSCHPQHGTNHDSTQQLYLLGKYLTSTSFSLPLWADAIWIYMSLKGLSS